MDTILLTGATGLLGNEILHALLRQDPNPTVLVLIRGDPRTSQARFDGLADESVQSEFARRVEPVWADLEKDGLGLSPQTCEELAARITHVIHSAAAVDFALPYAAARSANFDGTVRLVELVRRSRNLKAFAHISTAHVAGRRTGFVAEGELEHGCGFVNFYEQTKYETERFLRERMDELPIAVYRSTTLIGDSRTGIVRQFNFFHNAIRMYYHSLMPAIPGDPRGHLDLIPVDWAARAIRYLVIQNFHPATTYHVCAEPPRSYNLQQLIDATLSAFESSPYSDRHGIQKPLIVTPDQFDALMKEAQDDGRGKVLQLLKPLSYFMPHLALPKVFGADNLHRDLAASSDLAVPDVRDYYPKVVDFCLKTRWGRS
jgi:thioester reductase-like protein